MVKIAVHIQGDDVNTWSGHEFVELTRVPVPGECVSLNLDNSPGFLVTGTNHYAFSDHPDEVVAEVFVVPFEGNQAEFVRSQMKEASGKLNP